MIGLWQGSVTARQRNPGGTFRQAEPLLLDLEHALDHERGPDCLHDEAQRKAEGDGHAEQRDCKPPVEEGLADSRDQQQPNRGWAHALKDLRFPSALQVVIAAIFLVLMAITMPNTESLEQNTM